MRFFNIRTAAVINLLLALAPTICHGSIADTLVNNSKAVVIAAPVSFEDGAASTRIRLSVRSWLLPDQTGTQYIDVIWTAPESIRIFTQQEPPKSSGVWFLSKSATGEYTPMGVRHPAVGGARDLYFRAPQAACPPLLSAPKGAGLREKVGFLIACQVALDTTRQTHPTELLDFLYGFPISQSLQNAFRTLEQMPDSRHKAIGIAGLIQAGDPTALAQLEKNLSQILPEDLDQIVARPLFSSWRNPDVVATESLGRIATSPSLPPILLRAASTALLCIHTAAALPYFIQLMDNEDRDARIDAVLGFAGFANGLPIHTVDLGTVKYLLPSQTSWRSAETEQHFGLRREASESDIQSYVQFWKRWWALHKGAIAARTS